MVNLLTSPTRTCLLAGFLLILLAPSSALAQSDMSFGVDEVQQDQDDSSKDSQDQPSEDQGNSMSFGQEEVQENDSQQADNQTYTVAVTVTPSDALTNDQRLELQRRMSQAVSLDPAYQVRDGAPVLAGLQQAGLGTCITEPLCMSGVGQDAEVDRILLGRVEDDSRGLSLNVDLFDVGDKLFVKYTSESRLDDFDAVKDAVEPSMKDIFDIRIERAAPNYGEGASGSTVQKVLAYSAAGLSVVSLGAGIYFGMQASDGEDAILDEKGESGKFGISQAEAQEMVRGAEDDALTANVFYGASAGLAVLSGILFYVESGSDVAAPDERRRASVLDRIDVAPRVGRDKVGLGATFSF